MAGHKSIPRPLTVLGLFLAAGVIFLVGFQVAQTTQEDLLQKGFNNGYGIDGYYQVEQNSQAATSFHTEEGHRWQLSGKGPTVNGTFKETSLPNVFVLLDESGREYGHAILAYASPQGDLGVLYIETSEETIAFAKRTKDPGFINY